MFKWLIKKWWVWLIFIVLIGGGYWWWQSQQVKTENTAVVVKKTIKQELLLSGEIDAEEKVKLHFQSGGRLAWVGVKEGDPVKPNQAIAGLDIRQLKKDLEKKLQDFMTTRWSFEQTNDDYKVPGQALDMAMLTDEEKRIVDKSQFGLNKAVLDVEIQNLSIRFATLTSPIGGIVTQADTVHPGVNVSVTDTYEIINPDSFYFEVSADQTEVVDMYLGQPVMLTLDAFPDQPLAGEITWIGFQPKAGEVGTVYPLKVKFANSAPEIWNKFRLGMTGDATFVLKEKPEVLVIPLQFVKNDQDGNFVSLGKEKTRIPVTLGVESDTEVEIMGDINEGDVVYE